MRSLIVLLLAVGFLAAWAMLTVPTDHGHAALALQVGDRRAECLIDQVAGNWPRRVIGPWAVEEGTGGRYRVFGAFGQSWEFWRSEGTLSTTGLRGTNDFGTSPCD